MIDGENSLQSILLLYYFKSNDSWLIGSGLMAQNAFMHKQRQQKQLNWHPSLKWTTTRFSFIMEWVEFIVDLERHTIFSVRGMLWAINVENAVSVLLYIFELNAFSQHFSVSLKFAQKKCHIILLQTSVSEMGDLMSSMLFNLLFLKWEF